MKVFLDFEASSLDPDSVPIEIAWVDENGHSEGYLIRPADGWTDWNVAAESVHGISRARIAAEGHEALWVAERALDALSAHELFSDAPGFDGIWLAELLAVLPEPPALRLRILDVHMLYGHEIGRLRAGTRSDAAVVAIGRRLVAEAQEAEGRRPRTHHRAAEDARALWRTWCDIKRRVAGLGP